MPWEDRDRHRPRQRTESYASSAAGVTVAANGDFSISDFLTPAPPNPCATPVLLIYLRSQTLPAKVEANRATVLRGMLNSLDCEREGAPASASLRRRDPFSVGRTSPCARGARKAST